MGTQIMQDIEKLKNDKKDLYLGQSTYVIIREGEWNNARNGTG